MGWPVLYRGQSNREATLIGMPVLYGVQSYMETTTIGMPVLWSIIWRPVLQGVQSYGEANLMQRQVLRSILGEDSLQDGQSSVVTIHMWWAVICSSECYAWYMVSQWQVLYGATMLAIHASRCDSHDQCYGHCYTVPRFYVFPTLTCTAVLSGGMCSLAPHLIHNKSRTVSSAKYTLQLCGHHSIARRLQVLQPACPRGGRDEWQATPGSACPICIRHGVILTKPVPAYTGFHHSIYME